MSTSPFSLIPFDSGQAGGGLSLTGHIARQQDRLSIRYILQGPLSSLVLPQTCDQPTRRDGLWESTCFEFFLAVKGMTHYWEFNLSPAGHWNVYRLNGYRQALQPEASYPSLPFLVQRGPADLQLDLDCALPSGIAVTEELEVGICAVIAHRAADSIPPGPLQDGLSYWALSHPGPEPDFHRRDGFCLILPATIPSPGVPGPLACS